jgi:tRNA A-37 threonylcarbamoyl transferase component Bud32
LQDFISDTFRQVLASHRLDGFEQLWRYDGDWFEAPNHDRGGWSGVNRLVLERDGASPLVLFLKRQQNYMRRSLRHPLRGVSTFYHEYRNIRYLAERGVPVPTLAFFAQRPSPQGVQAILMTEELSGHLSLDKVVGIAMNGTTHTHRQKRMLIASVASTVRAMHAARVQHRALHAKHLLVDMRDPDVPRVVIIDFEKARVKWLFLLHGVRDLATLNRDLCGLSNAARMCFFKQYLGVEKLGFWSKLLCRLVVRRSRKRRQPPSVSAASA